MLFRSFDLVARTASALAIAIAFTSAPGFSFAAAASPGITAEPTCAALAADPAYGIAGNPAIKSATSVLVPAAGPNVAYCQVKLLYGTNPNQNTT